MDELLQALKKCADAYRGAPIVFAKQNHPRSYEDRYRDVETARRELMKAALDLADQVEA
jgi:hypothetical protein